MKAAEQFLAMLTLSQRFAIFVIIFTLPIGQLDAIFNCPCGQGIEGGKTETRIKRDVGLGDFSSDFRSSRYAKEPVQSGNKTAGYKSIQSESADRIVNGYEPNERAWMVHIRLTQISSICGGSLINRKYVLTAAHCVCSSGHGLDCKQVPMEQESKTCPGKKTRLKMSWNIRKMRLFLGITNVNSRYSLKNHPKFGKTRSQSPSKVIIHECYEDSSGTRFHDIALVKLKRSVDISPVINNVIDDDMHEVQPICLKHTKRAKKVYAAGWGKQRDDVCTTTLNSPSPNQRCKFPFIFNGHLYNQCIKSGTENLKGFSKNRKNKGSRACYKLYKQHKNEPWHGADVVHMKDSKGSLYYRCYMPGKGRGWCATCIDKAKKGEPGYCLATGDSTRQGANVFSKDKNSWGFCDTSKNGCRSRGGSTLASTLQEVGLRVMKKKKCKETFDKIKVDFNMKGETCAIGTYEKKIRTVVFKGSKTGVKFEIGAISTRSGQQGYRDTCSGDSGGPLFYWKGGKAYQYGIVSRGIGCARNSSPGIYTEVSPYLPWIKRNVSRRYNCRPVRKSKKG